MGRREMASRSIAFFAVGLVMFVMAACSGSAPQADNGDGGADASTQAAPIADRITSPPDTSRSVVQHPTTVESVQAGRSLPFAQLPEDIGPDEEVEHEPMRPKRPGWSGAVPEQAKPDQVVQSALPIVSMPASLMNFSGQGNQVGGPCQSGTSCSTPPDTNGAVGPNHFVQVTNVNGTSGIAIWNKSGTLLAGPKHVNTLWSTYPNTDGNQCATRNDGDPVVLYDQLADRWFITQFSLPNMNSNAGPAFQCVAVSQTSDPTGAYYLYDFKYSYAINDYGKFSVWPDAYYATFNMFGSTYAGADFCAYDRNSMLAGKTATQQCFLQAAPTKPPACPATQPFVVFGALPANMDGKIPPPTGEPGYFMQFDYSQCGPNYSQLDLWTLHVDWTTTANSKLTGPTAITVANFTPTCWKNTQTGGTGYPNCIPQPGSNVTLDALDDRLMFRFNYRNFGAYESLLVNHSVVGGGGTGGTTNTGSGVRWYEIRSPSTTPTVYQQSTYAPADQNWRWMASLAQDQAADLALGFAISSSTAGGVDVAHPSIAWTGRINTDAVSTMGQGETILDVGGGDENDAYPQQGRTPDELRGRWGDYSAMTVDPTDDCTFWYTQELYHQNAIGAWDTYIASMKFPNCAANDFSISISPAIQTVAPGGSVNYTVSTALTKGTAESIALYIQNLPTGVTGAFNPTSVTAGGTSTLTLTAAATAPLTGTPAPTFMVIGKAPSAVHAATAQIAVANTCTPITTCPAGDNCGTVSNGCGGTINCGTCTAPQTCGGGGTANVCGCKALTACPAGDNCGTVSNGCGGTISCGTCAAPQTCGGAGTANVCGCTALTACPAGDNCGTVSNGCGGTINCGTCTAPQTCGGAGTANVCGCTPLTACPAGDNCGTVSNGCGGTLNCGTCAAPQTCGGAGTANVCGCTPLISCPAGDNCGTVPDGCGGAVLCGTCGLNQTCVANQCQNNVVDAGTTDAGSVDAGGTSDSGAADSGATDSGTTSDAGALDSGVTDSGAADSGATDSGAADSGAADSGAGATDSGSGNDSGALSDGSSGDDGGFIGDDAGDDGGDAATTYSFDGGSANTVQPGGCGCRTAGTEESAPRWAHFGLGALAIAALRLRRRSRRSPERDERRP